ncbi:hypothetical protein, partial [Rhizobium ruizarguesonis]|uniref:hypothetical protein n=1 Tax=Rhizobium ruizarguesonis TaxID=2081791 RepID=UPI001954E43E
LEGVPAIHDHFELWPSPTEIARSNILGLKQTFSALDKYYIVSSSVFDGQSINVRHGDWPNISKNILLLNIDLWRSAV